MGNNKEQHENRWRYDAGFGHPGPVQCSTNTNIQQQLATLWCVRSVWAVTSPTASTPASTVYRQPCLRWSYPKLPKPNPSPSKQCPLTAIRSDILSPRSIQLPDTRTPHWVSTIPLLLLLLILPSKPKEPIMETMPWSSKLLFN